MRTARRIDAIPPYLFAEIDRKIAERRAAGVDVISFGVGDPDLPTPDFVVEELARAAADPSTHQYPGCRRSGARSPASTGGASGWSWMPTPRSCP